MAVRVFVYVYFINDFINARTFANTYAYKHAFTHKHTHTQTYIHTQSLINIPTPYINAYAWNLFYRRQNGPPRCRVLWAYAQAFMKYDT